MLANGSRELHLKGSYRNRLLYLELSVKFLTNGLPHALPTVVAVSSVSLVNKDFCIRTLIVQLKGVAWGDDSVLLFLRDSRLKVTGLHFLSRTALGRIDGIVVRLCWCAVELWRLRPRSAIVLGSRVCKRVSVMAHGNGGDLRSSIVGVLRRASRPVSVLSLRNTSLCQGRRVMRLAQNRHSRRVGRVGWVGRGQPVGRVHVRGVAIHIPRERVHCGRGSAFLCERRRGWVGAERVFLPGGSEAVDPRSWLINVAIHIVARSARHLASVACFSRAVVWIMHGGCDVRRRGLLGIVIIIAVIVLAVVAVAVVL